MQKNIEPIRVRSLFFVLPGHTQVVHNTEALNLPSAVKHEMAQAGVAHLGPKGRLEPPPVLVPARSAKRTSPGQAA